MPAASLNDKNYFHPFEIPLLFYYFIKKIFPDYKNNKPRYNNEKVYGNYDCFYAARCILQKNSGIRTESLGD